MVWGLLERHQVGTPVDSVGILGYAGGGLDGYGPLLESHPVGSPVDDEEGL